jgi:hypothetical protein
MNDTVRIYRYVTKGTFDAYNWGIIENKQKFIAQVMTSGDVARSCADIDETVLNYAQMKAAASDNPLIKEKMEVDSDVTRLQLLKRNFMSSRYNLERELKNVLPEKREHLKAAIQNVTADIEMRNSSQLFKGNADNDGEVEIEKTPFSMTFSGKEVTERKIAGEFVNDVLKKTTVHDGKVKFACYAGFDICAKKELGAFGSEVYYFLIIKGKHEYEVNVNFDGGIGSILKMQNAVRNIDRKLDEFQRRLSEVEDSINTSQLEYDKPFQKEDELQRLLVRQQELNELLYEDNESEQSIQKDDIESESKDGDVCADEVSDSCIRMVQRRRFAM